MVRPQRFDGRRLSHSLASGLRFEIAMKMEHVHPAATAGVVTAVHVAVGGRLSSGRVIVELESETVPVQSAATGYGTI